MYKKVTIEIVFWLICIKPISAQCFGGDSLLLKLNILRDSSKLSFKAQIKELSRYEAGMAGCVYDHDSVHAILLMRKGKAYSSLSDYLRAVYYCQRAIDLITLNADKHSINPRHLIPGYYWLSAFYDSLHLVTEKMKALDSCASVAIRLKSIDLYCLRALYTRAVYSFDIGDYHRCIDYANLCESLASEYSRNGSTQNFSDGTQYAMSSLIWSVNAMILLKDYEGAEALLKNKAEESKREGLKNYLGVIYGLLAEVLVFKGNCEKALLWHNKAFAIEQLSGSTINCKAMLNGIGHDVYLKYYNNVDKALEYYRKALGYKVNEKELRILNSLESLSILNRIGNVYMLKGQYDSALNYMQHAFDKIKPGISEKEILNSSLDEFVRQRRIGYIATLIIDKAEVYHQKYKATGDLNTINEAIRIYKVADQFLERIKNEQFDVRSKLFWRSDRRRLYERAIEACYANGNKTDAFYFFERSRAVLLYDQLNKQRWLEEGDIVRQTKLKKRVIQLEKESAQLNKPQDNSLELQKEMISSKQELDQLDNKIKDKNPLYYQFFLETGNITLRDVQKVLLKGSDKLVEFFEGDSAVYSLTITPGQVYLERIDKDTFDQTVTEFVTYISDHSLLNKNFNGFINTSYRLNQLIFQQHEMPSGRIIISPDGRYFPIEALVTRKSAPLTYLIQTHPVSYTHSARFLMIDFNTGPEATNRNFIGMAPVNYQANLNQASLIGSDVSLQAVKSNFRNAEIKTFKNASRDNFLQEFSDYKIIQLYTHAADKKNTGDPEIYFADSILYLSDLITEKKPITRLIVLSACETGTGQWYRGEGVFSFGRGFATLGIPSSVTNLWSVDNVSTYRLTEFFYKYLVQGLPIDISLQKAKLEFIKNSSKEKSLPYYWAATILVGKTDAIELKKAFPWKLLAFLMALVGGLSFFGYRLWIRKRNRISKMSTFDTVSS